MITIDRGKCTKCGVCIKVCPRHVLSLGENCAELTDFNDCMECGACMLNCEFNAIEVTKGTGCLYAIIKEDILKITPKGTGCCGPKGCC